jgi:predicted phosphodiesterase
MRVAALYDIHANLPALEAVLEAIAEAPVDCIVVGGDVFPGPLPCESLACLLDLRTPVQFIHGNGDREVLAQMSATETRWYQTAPEQWREPVRWTAQQLQPEQRQLLAGWPGTLRLRISGLGDVLFCHATPRNDTDVFTRLTPDERVVHVFAGVDAPLVICGHTHMPFDRAIGAIRVVNAGSVGMPFGRPGADWLLLGPDVEFRHTSYDLHAAADRIKRTEYPQAEDFAANHVLQVPSAEQMLEAFSQAELS